MTDEEINSIEALKRKLQPGMKLRLVRTTMGETDLSRTVQQVRTRDVVMVGADGRESFLTITSGFKVLPKDNGFAVTGFNGLVMAEYKFAE